ncbi:Uncharacterized protein dnm_068350 [Desulfonema magnum]|uniref:Uncharacterized protein n=1 Tax=Desulfonema magnum TaxID=45655 RepID=A0A975BT65_9BACT|nr:Uncharacterized protein dnm_068350 [Desulfonema magnum]
METAEVIFLQTLIFGLWTNKFALKQLSKIITLFLIVIKCK